MSAVAPLLPPSTALRLLALVTLVLAPHALRVPIWASAVVVAGLAWQLAHLHSGLPLPGRLLRSALTVAAFVGVFLSYGRINGQHSGTALLVLMTVLKLLELRNARDLRVMVFLLYFLLLTHFLFSQALWTLAWMLGCAVGITALLVELQHPDEDRGFGESLRTGAVLVAQALPVMLVLFILFPRIPGPLWGLPADAGATARTGLSEQMAPGDIAELIQSEAVAFRVRFEGEAPPARELYWRGPVFERFDGRRWEALPLPADERPPAIAFSGRRLGYELLLEPSRQRWLLALETPDPATLPERSRLGRDGVLLGTTPVNERRLLRLASDPEARLEPETLPRFARTAALQLPAGTAPRARALAAQWREAGLNDAAVVAQSLRLFRDEPFRYTLRPPRLGAQPVDEFLFGTRAGFCEHYASSFVVLMRAAGIPARVVTGYQGGEWASVGGDFLVRQSDAHAWAEVWLEGQGWLRVDPTAAVSPDRIEQGLRGALADDEALPAFLRRSRESLWELGRAQWEFLDAQWSRWVLAYGPELQQRFLARFGLRDFRAMVLALTALVSALLALVALWLVWQRRPPPTDAPHRLWRGLQRRLARRGLPPMPGEGPIAYTERAAARFPDRAEALRSAAGLYVGLRYLKAPPAAEQAAALYALRRACRAAARRR